MSSLARNEFVAWTEHGSGAELVDFLEEHDVSEEEAYMILWDAFLEHARMSADHARKAAAEGATS